MWSISYSHMLQQCWSHDLSVITMKQDSSYAGGHCILTPLVYHSYLLVWKRRHSLPPVFNHFQTGDGEGLTMRVEEWALLWMQTDSKQQGGLGQGMIGWHIPPLSSCHIHAARSPLGISVTGQWDLIDQNGEQISEITSRAFLRGLLTTHQRGYVMKRVSSSTLGNGYQSVFRNHL